jgi:hypothetical protein
VIDKRLTAEEKKKIKPVNQGGGPNYLGKQEMVTAPKKWLSDPDHVVAELAYITPKEKEMLIKADIYGSLDGKPNKGPSGIQSLQGDLGGYDASSGGPNDPGSGGGGNRAGETDQNKQRVQDILTGKVVTGQTAAKGPRTTQYSNLPEYMKVLQPDGTYKDTYVGSAYKSYGTPTFFGNLFSRGAPGYRGIKGLPAFGDPMKNYNVNMAGPDGPGYYTDKTNFTEMRSAMPPIGILGILSNIFGSSKKPSMYDDMSKYNKLGLYTDRFPEGTGTPTQQGDYDIYGNKINELTGEVIDPVTGEVMMVIPGYPGGDKKGITTVKLPTGGDNDVRDLVETIDETVDDNITDEDLLLRYLGLDSTINPKAAGFTTVADVRDLQQQRAKDIFTT